MTQFKSISMRFLKGAIAGAVGSMAIISLKTPAVWGDYFTMLNTLALAGAYGATTGILLAAEKWTSWKEVPPSI